MKNTSNFIAVNDTCRKISIRSKMIILLALSLFIFGFTAAAISYKMYMDSSIEEYTRFATGVAELSADVINPDHVDEYLEKGISAEGYKEIQQKLYKIRESSPNIKFIYVYRILEDGCHVVFDLDTEELKATPVGEVEEFDDEFIQYLPILTHGGNIEPIISDGTYGWLLSVYRPIHDSKGKYQCYAAVDVSLDDLREQSQIFIRKLAIIFIVIFLFILLSCYQLAKYNLIVPLNKMAHFSGKFAYNSEEEMEKNLENICNLKIHTGDEIENLYLAFVKMTNDSVKYMKDVKNKNEAISQMQNALIITLADLVESRDENTGQHIKKTAAYVRILLEELKREGEYKEQLTDDFIEKVVNSAPLHDIGKITVPDSILNKPGKLTDEEFEIMKNHTTAGGKIISSIIETVPDSHYLEEAKNLAMYHHEKWNGRGYPTGIAGEDIPLSARVMAVADVFDALVSRRSYKEGFPYEKAFAIIKEESGTHFDPKLVHAFFEAKNKILEVAKIFNKL